MNQYINLIVGVVLLAWFTVMLWCNKIHVGQVKAVADVANTRGGNILVLLVLSISFFLSSIRMFYWTIDKVATGTLTQDNALVLAGWAFVTGTAFGGAFGAMLNTMSGNHPAKPEDEKPVGV